MNLGKIVFCFIISIFFFYIPITSAQEIHNDLQGIWRGKVIEILSQEVKNIPGTETPSTYQEIRAELLDGEKKGQIITIENDFLKLKKGDKFFLFYNRDIDGREMYSVRDLDRRGTIGFFVGLFILTIIAFGGKQGIRSLISLAGSFIIILYVLIPYLLKGYPPVLTSIIIASLILFLAIYITHGLNRQSTVAFLGTVSAIIITGFLAFFAVKLTKLTGFASDESIYLNFNTQGTLDFAGLLLGGIIIGVLGVLDDIAITQAAIVTELFDSASSLSRKEVYIKALRVGKEHVGALVNTLALAYTGASLPLLLYFSTSTFTLGSIVNQEVFATEIIRTIVGSIGLILTVPITTLLAVYMLKGYKGKNLTHAHTHSH